MGFGRSGGGGGDGGRGSRCTPGVAFNVVGIW